MKKLGSIPIGGGWRFVGRAQGNRNRAASDLDRRKGKNRDPLFGHAFVHTVIDEHSRVAYAEIHDDERADTAIGVLRRAVSSFADRGVTIERVLSDNGPAYRSHAWRHTCNDLEITPKLTRPRRLQTDGKIERFHRTVADRRAYSKHYNSESARRAALPAWLHFYNTTAPNTAIGKLPPISRIRNNPPGHYTWANRAESGTTMIGDRRGGPDSPLRLDAVPAAVSIMLMVVVTPTANGDRSMLPTSVNAPLQT